MDQFRELLKNKKRIVVKIGSSSLRHKETGDFDFVKIDTLVRELCDLRNQGKDVILVSSGAIAAGRKVVHIEAAEKDKLVDVHCDEIDDEASRGLETVAARALELELFDKVTASHTTAMHSYNNAYVLRLMRLLKMSRINFVSNPLVNTHLQGRADTYPKRRGVTRVKELLTEGINVSFGHDDIFDPWYPMGNGSLRDVVFLGLHVTQMMGYEEIMNSYRLITTNAAKTLHISDHYGIEVGKPAGFVVLDAENYYEALNKNAAVLLSVKDGRKIASTSPANTEVLF